VNENTLNILGKVEGKLDMVIGNGERLEAKLDALDVRLRDVEKKATVSSLVVSSVVSVGVALAAAALTRLWK
jgi:hypothetical protein